MPPGEPKELADVVLGGRPGSVSGKVIAPDVTGAKVRLVVPGIADALDTRGGRRGQTCPPTARSPSRTCRHRPRYQLVVEHGPATPPRRSRSPMEPAQVVERLIEIRLGGGDGVITGHLRPAVSGLGGRRRSTPPTAPRSVSMVSLTEDDVGAFTIRGLATPGRYTVTFSRRRLRHREPQRVLAQGESVTLDVNLAAVRFDQRHGVNAATGGRSAG